MQVFCRRLRERDIVEKGTGLSRISHRSYYLEAWERCRIEEECACDDLAAMSKLVAARNVASSKRVSHGGPLAIKDLQTGTPPPNMYAMGGDRNGNSRK